nr:WYL domain-containing protein [Moraxella sp.]
MSKDHDKIALRLAMILQKLNQGETLYETELAEEFNVSLRTIQRDMRERLVFLPFIDSQKGYQLDTTFLGKFDIKDIKRFAKFASIKDLFGKIDQDFFQKYLTDSIAIKGFNIEKIDGKHADFDTIHQATKQHKLLTFDYQKSSESKPKSFQTEPYKLMNKNGIWYLIAVHDDKIKVFSFTKISKPKPLEQTFKPNIPTLDKINSYDSIYFEGVIDKVVLTVNTCVSEYFLRRALLPNQSQVEETLDGMLTITCCNVHERDILPLVQSWLPHVTINEPSELQDKLEAVIKGYLDNKKKSP